MEYLSAQGHSLPPSALAVRRFSSLSARRRVGGLTLAEILVVIAVIVILNALLFAALKTSKLSARRAQTMSNLRQCGIALHLYENEHGAYPIGDAASIALASAPTNDANDYWRQSVQDKWGPPLIGSYAYIGLDQLCNSPNAPLGSLCPDQDKLDKFLAQYPNGPLMATNFYANSPSSPFHGDGPPLPLGHRYPGPDPVVCLRVDGSVAVSHLPWREDTSFSWSNTFSKLARQANVPE